MRYLVCIDAPSGIVAWWPGDGPIPGDNTGVVVEDIIGNNEGELFEGATYAPGKVGQAFSFDDNTVFAGGDGLNDLPQFTIEFWALSDDFLDLDFISEHLEASKFEYISFHGPRFFLYHDVINNPGQISYSMFVAGGQPTIKVDNVLLGGVWQHIAASYDEIMMRLYIDGVEVGSMAESRKIDLGAGGPLIGGGIHSTGDNIHGLIDEVSMYNRALTAEEILAIYNADIAGKCK